MVRFMGLCELRQGEERISKRPILDPIVIVKFMGLCQLRQGEQRAGKRLTGSVAQKDRDVPTPACQFATLFLKHRPDDDTDHSHCGEMPYGRIEWLHSILLTAPGVDRIAMLYVSMIDA